MKKHLNVILITFMLLNVLNCNDYDPISEILQNAENSIEFDTEKISDERKSFYLCYKSLNRRDFRLSYITPELLEKLEAENCIIVDTTGMVKRSEEKGIYKLKLKSKRLPDILNYIMKKEKMTLRAFPECMLIQERNALTDYYTYFIYHDKLKDIVVEPGDIIAIYGL